MNFIHFTKDDLSKEWIIDKNESLIERSRCHYSSYLMPTSVGIIFLWPDFHRHHRPVHRTAE